MSTVYQDAVAVYGSEVKAARAMNMPRETFRRRHKQEKELGFVRTGTSRDHIRAPGTLPRVDVRGEKADGISVPRLPDRHVPTAELLDRLERESELIKDRVAAEHWIDIKVNDKKPIAAWWFGDPHIGDRCDIKRLRRDVDITANTPGVYGVNIGDVTDNWVTGGSLARLASEQNLSRHSERQLARWFLQEAGICWLMWIHGNHDEWNDSARLYEAMNVANHVVAESQHRQVGGELMLEWAARMRLQFHGHERPISIHAAHDFPGHSMWNPTHALLRAPRMLGNAVDLYVAGHKHTFGIQQLEMPEADLLPTGLRVRGYKRWDPHAKRLGYAEDKHGCGALTIFVPGSTEGGRILPFIDIEQGVRVLKALRGEEVLIFAPRAKKPAKARQAPAKTKRKARALGKRRRSPSR